VCPDRILIAGFPRAGKSSFADAVEASPLGLVHIPMDHYIMPMPEEVAFLDWVRTPACIDWMLLQEHMEILASGRICFTPRPDWSARGRRICPGGPLSAGSGRKMRPGIDGYIVAGTHAFSLGGKIGTHLKVFMETPETVIASRLEGRPVSHAQTEHVLRRHLSDNLAPLRGLRSAAALVIDGTWPHDTQVAVLQEYLRKGKDPLHNQGSGSESTIP
jgi:hypothetical protein